jgi:hypothetical protein
MITAAKPKMHSMSPNLRRSPLADERVVADYSRPRPEFQPRIVTAAVDTTRAS